MKLFNLILFISLVAVGCNSEDPFISNEDELITTVIYTLTPVAGGDPVVFSFQDLDGEGSTPPVIINGTLNANTVYNGELSLLNETTTPPEDIGAEVGEESEDHQFFFAHEGSLAINVLYADTDTNGDPLGLLTTLETGVASAGELVITLKHLPKKPNNGTLADAGGVSDVEVVFSVTIQ